MEYYSARLQIVCVVDNAQAMVDNQYTTDNPVVVFTAANDEAALEIALEFGLRFETEYKNSDGERVGWKFREIQQLHRLGTEIDGMEVDSQLDSISPDDPIKIDQEMYPESCHVRVENTDGLTWLTEEKMLRKRAADKILVDNSTDGND